MNLQNIKLEKIYLIIALIVGIVIIFITPPFQAPDEDSHFKKTYLISKGEFYPIVENEQIGNYFPLEMLEFISEKGQYIGNREMKYSFSQMVNEQYDTMNYEEQEFNKYSTSSTNAIAYIAPATGVLVSKVCANIFGMHSISTTFMLYFARIFSLISVVIITYFAIKTTPIFKKTMIVIALMPMTIFQMSVLTYDNLLIAITLLTIAMLLKLIFDKDVKTVNWKYIAIMIICGYILFNIKTVYSVVFILAFFIPQQKFGGLKGMIQKFLIIGLSVLISTIILNIPNYLLPEYIDGGAQSSSEQISWIMSNPLEYVKIFIMDTIEQRAWYLTGMVGILGLLDVYLPLPLIFIYLMFLVTMFIVDGSESEFKINWKMKLGLIFAIAIGIIGIISALYISWTSQMPGYGIGATKITGVQGRYFVPLLLPIGLIFSNKLIKNNKVFEFIRKYFIILIIASLAITLICLLIRYWI